jgi:N-acetylglutamate synthase-like GNAT family acetyltransferase
MMTFKEFELSVSNESNTQFAKEIELLIKQTASENGVGLCLMSAQSIGEKIINGDAIIATKDGQLAGFCYLRQRIEDDYVSISGIVIAPQYKGMGLRKAMIKEMFHLGRSKYSQSKLYSLTTSTEVMLINNKLGYKPVNYSRLSTSGQFWAACLDCSNYHFLQKNKNTRCLCSAMLFNPFNFNIEDEYALNDQSVKKKMQSTKQSN